MLSEIKSKIKKPFVGKKSDIKEEESQAKPVTPPPDDDGDDDDRPVEKDRVNSALNSSEQQAKKKSLSAKVHGDATREETGANEKRGSTADKSKEKSTKGHSNTHEQKSERESAVDGPGGERNVHGVDHMPAAAMADNAPVVNDAAQGQTGDKSSEESNESPDKENSEEDSSPVNSESSNDKREEKTTN